MSGVAHAADGPHSRPSTTTIHRRAWRAGGRARNASLQLCLRRSLLAQEGPFRRRYLRAFTAPRLHLPTFTPVGRRTRVAAAAHLPATADVRLPLFVFTC